MQQREPKFFIVLRDLGVDVPSFGLILFYHAFQEVVVSFVKTSLLHISRVQERE
jgi:hypothetical protein